MHYLKSAKHFRAECPEIYKHFLGYYDIPRDTLILHDGGRAYKVGSKSIFEELGFTNDETYPSEVHQYLSPNDNSLHGCKSKWAEEYYDFDDTVSGPLRLMQLLDADTEKNSKMYFRRNMFAVTKAYLDSFIGV